MARDLPDLYDDDMEGWRTAVPSPPPSVWQRVINGLDVWLGAFLFVLGLVGLWWLVVQVSRLLRA